MRCASLNQRIVTTYPLLLQVQFDVLHRLAMTKVPQALLLGSIALCGVTTATRNAAAQPAPSGAHPRIWLNAATRSQISSQASVANGPVGRGAARCTAAREKPAEYAA